MQDDGKFALNFHHGGKFVHIEGSRFYDGGSTVVRDGFDVDEFGYFEMEDVVRELGYTKWKCIAYKVPGKLSFVDLKDDRDAMAMTKYFSEYLRIMNVYVDDGVRDCESEKGSLDDLDQSGETVSKARTKGKGSRIEAVASSTVQKDRGKAVQQVFEPILEENEEVHSEDKSCHESEEDENEDVDIETDDGLDDDELGSGDEEYQQARQNMRQADSQHVDEFVDLGCHMIELEDREEHHSDYIDSDGEVDSESSEEEDADDVVPRPRTVKVRYDPTCDHKNLKLCLGMRFESGFQCKEALKTWSIYGGHPIQFRRVSKNQIQASCKEPCPWKFYASLKKREGTVCVKKLREPHSCAFDVRNKQTDYKWIGKQYMNVFRVRPSMTAAELEVDINEKYHIKVPRGRLHRAKNYAFDLLRGTVREHYHSMRSYLSELMRVDREGRFEMKLGDGAVFQRLYIGFSALKKGFMLGCRRIIGLDGCFLKTYLKGQLLCAVAKDGNNQMFPISWAVVEVENQETCSWFIQILLEELGVTSGQGLTFISDQQKGLLNAVKTHAPLAEHRNCARHVYCNWKKQFKGQTLKNIFWKTVRCTYEVSWNDAMEEMKAENPRAYENFLEREPTKFCKTFVSTHCVSDMVDNNVSETFNGWIVRARTKHIIQMLEDIRSALRERQYVKLEMIKKVKDRICPNIKKKG